MLSSLLNGGGGGALSIHETQELLIEKKNIINISKLVVRDLIEASLMNERRAIDTHSSLLTAFLTIIDNLLTHGLKAKKGLNYYYSKRELTTLLELIGTKCDTCGALNSIRDMAGIKTSLGRIRAWAILSLMQKTMAENFTRLIGERNKLSEIYEADALLMSDDAAIISGRSI